MNTLIIFIKHPEPGKVKTRLARDIGETKATRIYSYMAETIIDKTSDPINYITIIFYDPPGKVEEIKNWINKREVQYLPQTGSNLGDKISNAFEKVFTMGTNKAVIIGSDCIDVSKDIINEALSSLESTDVILGPAEDGGYYLLGLSKFVPEIFQDIEWSTENVLRQTIEKISENNLKFNLLKSLKDIDTVDDLKEANIEYSGIEITIS